VLAEGSSLILENFKRRSFYARPGDIIVETPIPKANNLKVTVGVEELVS
jgi:hypothetical protein